MSVDSWGFAYLLRNPVGSWRCVHGNFFIWIPSRPAGERRSS